MSDFSCPIYDAAFKYVMSDPAIRLSFLQTFAPNEHITSSIELSEYLTPLAEHKKARETVHSKSVVSLMERIKAIPKSKDISVILEGLKGDSEALWQLAYHYEQILKVFPDPHRNSRVDLLCTVDGGSHILVEIQAIPQNFWDKRALAYAAKIYGDQLKRGGNWSEIKRVVGINILGNQPMDYSHWRGEDVGNGIRHYKFQDDAGRVIEDGIEIIQYAVEHINPPTGSDVTFAEWVDYFKRANERSMAYLESIRTEAVKNAYLKLRLDEWPESIKERYNQQVEDFGKYSQNTDYEIAKGKAEGKAEGERLAKIETARNLKALGMPTDIIAKATGLSESEIEGL